MSTGGAVDGWRRLAGASGRAAAARLGLAMASGLLLLGLVATSACSTTAYYERERIADHAMQLDPDPALVFIRNKIEAAREGALGGFGGSAAGGCGCQ